MNFRVRVLLAVAALVSGPSCGKLNTLNSFASDAGRYSITGSTEFLAVREILSAKCADCHSYFLENTEAAWLVATDDQGRSLVVAQDPEGSVLFQSLKLAGGTMPPTSDTWVSADVETFRAWINSL